MKRRSFLKQSAFGVLAVAPGIQLLMPTKANAKGKVVIQYDWLVSNGQFGDVMAITNGYFKKAGLDVEISPGGPNSATAPAVVSGAATLGQFSETAQLFNARASGIPLKIIACGFRTGPYAFTSKPSKPLRSVDDLRNIKIGIQPTARFAIEAVAAVHNIPMSELKVINVGFDKGPLVRGEVDAIGGWITNTEALSVVGDDRIDLLVSDLGLPTYANVYFATDDAIKKNSAVLAAFIGAVSEGWGWVHGNPEEAVRKAVKAYPALSLEWELKTIDLVKKLSFDADTKRNGWGTFSTDKLESQLALLDSIGQYPNGRPTLKDVYTNLILEMTSKKRPKV